MKPAEASATRTELKFILAIACALVPLTAFLVLLHH